MRNIPSLPSCIRKILEFTYDDFIGRGKFLDASTLNGAFRGLVFWCIALYFMWNAGDFFSWLNRLCGVDSQINSAKQDWAQLWALIIGGSGIVVSLSTILDIIVKRYRINQSTKGQWHDTQNLKPEDLRDEAVPMSAEEGFSVQENLPLPDIAGPAWTDPPQTPVGVASPPEAKPARQFGAVRLETKDGHLTLTVPRKK